MKGQPNDNKHTDKFGYASIQVGDSAALFSKHFEEYGVHYGEAAKNIGKTLGVDGSAYGALQAGQRFFSLAGGGLPVLGVGALASSAATTLQAVASVRNANRLVEASEAQLGIREAEHLLHATRPEALEVVLATALLYGKEANASRIHLVVSDTYHAAQLRLLQQLPEYADRYGPDIIQIFETLPESFQAVSTTKCLIYFHTMKTITVPQDLDIKDCRDFVLRSDAGQAGLQPRLVLTGTTRILRSKGTIQSAAVCGGVSCDQESQVTFDRCTNTAKGAKSFSDLGSTKRTGGFYWGNQIIAPAVAILVSAVLFSLHRSNSSR